ncbi:FixH family protein [Bacillus sp. MRMR6]|uniref:FixH family protein n=1 Tax=Bacillus sp. MRMR6 TaxID=1928617 RepID=UPI000951BDB0|nr:FixH family protein [Bacillus sp. MRMR6]OLS40063.1 hypothetical protein BTR25_11345 [Bacillus sp. MRMR6]
MKGYRVLLLFLLTVFLSSCSLNEGTEKLYREENVLKIDIVLPSELEAAKEYEIQAILTTADGKVPEIKDITMTIWKNGKDPDEVIVPENIGEGQYKIDATFTEEGLYFVKVQASTKDSKIMPTKQFTVGSLTEEDLKTLPNHSEEHKHEEHH